MMSWHLTVVSIFVVGATIYIIANWSDRAGWVYVFLLLMGIIMWAETHPVNGQKFSEQLRAFGFA